MTYFLLSPLNCLPTRISYFGNKVLELQQNEHLCKSFGLNFTPQLCFYKTPTIGSACHRPTQASLQGYRL